MKKLSMFVSVLALLAVSAFAADSGSSNIRIDSPVKVGTVELPAGYYKLTWTGTGDNAQVILKQGKVSATAPVRVVEQKRNSDALVTRSDNGARVLTEIQLKDTTLLLNPAATATAGK